MVSRYLLRRGIAWARASRLDMEPVGRIHLANHGYARLIQNICCVAGTGTVLRYATIAMSPLLEVSRTVQLLSPRQLGQTAAPDCATQFLLSANVLLSLLLVCVRFDSISTSHLC